MLADGGTECRTVSVYVAVFLKRFITDNHVLYFRRIARAVGPVEDHTADLRADVPRADLARKYQLQFGSHYLYWDECICERQHIVYVAGS